MVPKVDLVARDEEPGGGPESTRRVGLKEKVKRSGAVPPLRVCVRALACVKVRGGAAGGRAGGGEGAAPACLHVRVRVRVRVRV